MLIGGERYGEEKKQVMTWSMPPYLTNHVKHSAGNVMPWASELAHYCLLIIWLLTELAGWSLKCTWLFSAHIQANEFLKEWNGRFFNAQSVIWSLTEVKTQGRDTNKQAITQSGYRRRPDRVSQRRKWRIWWSPWFLDFTPSLSAKDFYPTIKVTKL